MLSRKIAEKIVKKREIQKLDDYLDILKTSNSVDEVESVMDDLTEQGQKIIPDILPYIQNKSNTWKLRYRLLKILLKIGIQDLQHLEFLKKQSENEDDEAIFKIIQQILSQAVVKVEKNTSSEKELSPTWIKIPAFDQAEMEELRPFLKEKEISFTEIQLQLEQDNGEDATVRYVLAIAPELFDKTISIIQDFLGLNEIWTFTGSCPGCGYECDQVKHCPSCNLKLQSDPLLELSNHPFVLFLYQEGLLKKKLEGHQHQAALEAKFKVSLNPIDFLEPK